MPARRRADRRAAAAARALSKFVGRTVITFTASSDLTVAIALPAYVGRTKVASSFTSITSESCATSSSAATRGKTPFVNADDAPTTCVKPPACCMPTRSGVHSSASPCASAGCSSSATLSTPATLGAVLEREEVRVRDHCAGGELRRELRTSAHDAQLSPAASSVVGPARRRR